MGDGQSGAGGSGGGCGKNGSRGSTADLQVAYAVRTADVNERLEAGFER